VLYVRSYLKKGVEIYSYMTPTNNATTLEPHKP